MQKLKYIYETLERIKATNIKIYDLKSISPFADYSVVATIDVNKQGNACINYLNDYVKEEKIKIKNVEGRESNWILIDLYDVIIHLFTKEERKNYDLDRLYMDLDEVKVN